MDKEYFVFISYSSLDNDWAVWLRDELEHYHLPASFNGRTDVRENLREVFRDRDELSAGPEWDEQVRQALVNTDNLIVICSPNAFKSDAVNREVETFIAMGKEEYIFPFIVEGEPRDSFPPALKHSKLGGDINKDGGSNAAFIKVVAGMLKVGFPSLWERYEREKAEEERKIREQRDKLLRIQSLFLAEKANDLVELGDSYTARLLALEALPKDLINEDRPLVENAKKAFINATAVDTATMIGNGYVGIIQFSTDGKYIIGRDFTSSWGQLSYITTFNCWDINNGKLVATRKALCISPNAQYYANELADGTFAVFETISGNLYYSVDLRGNYIQNASFGDDSKKIILLFRNEEIWILDVSNGDYLQNFQYDGKIKDIKISKDGKKMSILSLVSKGKNAKTWRVVVWNLERHEKEINPWGIPSNGIDSIEFSHNANYVITRKNGKTIIEILDIYKNGNRLRAFKQEKGDLIEHIATCANDKFLLSSSTNTRYLWDIETGWSLTNMHHKIQDKITYLNLSDDGHIAFALTLNSNLHQWKVMTGEEIKLTVDDSLIKSPTYSPDGNCFAYISKNVIKMTRELETRSSIISNQSKQLIDELLSSDSTISQKYSVSVENKQIIKVREHDTGKIISWNTNKDIFLIILSPDNKYVATEDKSSICIWNLFSRKLTDEFHKENNYKAAALYFSMDGTLHALYKSKVDDSVIQYNYTPLYILIEKTRRRFANRELTQEEKKIYFIDEV